MNFVLVGSQCIRPSNNAALLFRQFEQTKTSLIDVQNCGRNRISVCYTSAEMLLEHMLTHFDIVHSVQYSIRLIIKPTIYD